MPNINKHTYANICYSQSQQEVRKTPKNILKNNIGRRDIKGRLAERIHQTLQQI